METVVPCNRLSRSDEYFDTLSERMPAMTHLFTIFADGCQPNFLDVIAALSEMVAFYTDCEQISELEEEIRKNRSQNNCRFCS